MISDLISLISGLISLNRDLISRISGQRSAVSAIGQCQLLINVFEREKILSD